MGGEHNRVNCLTWTIIMSKSKASKLRFRKAMEKRRRPFEMRPTIMCMRRSIKLLLGGKL